MGLNIPLEKAILGNFIIEKVGNSWSTSITQQKKMSLHLFVWLEVEKCEYWHSFKKSKQAAFLQQYNLGQIITSKPGNLIHSNNFCLWTIQPQHMPTHAILICPMSVNTNLLQSNSLLQEEKQRYKLRCTHLLRLKPPVSNLYISWRIDLFLLSFSQSGLYVLIICMICRPQHSTYTDFFITMLIYLKIDNLPIPRCMGYVMGKLPSPLWRKSNLESGAQWTYLNHLSSFYSLKQLQSLYEWLDACSKWLLWTGILLPGLRNSSVFDSCYACQSFALRWCCLIFTKKQYAISSVLPSPYFTFKDLLHDNSLWKIKM